GSETAEVAAMPEILKTIAERVRPDRAAILVVDMQNDFCAENGYIHKTRNADVSPNRPLAKRIQELVDHGRAAGTTIVWVKANYEPRYLSAPALLKREERGAGAVCCQGGSWGWEFFEVKPDNADLIVEKHTFSAFVGTDLDALLRARNIKTLVL